MIHEADDTIKGKEELLSSLTREQTKVRKEMDRFCQLHIDEELTSKGFGERYNPLEEPRFQRYRFCSRIRRRPGGQWRTAEVHPNVPFRPAHLLAQPEEMSADFHKRFFQPCAHVVHIWPGDRLRYAPGASGP